MSFQFQIHGVGVRGDGTGPISLSWVGGDATLEAADFADLVRLLHVVAALQGTAIVPPGAVQPLRVPGRPKALPTSNTATELAGSTAAAVSRAPTRVSGRPAQDRPVATPAPAAKPGPVAHAEPPLKAEPATATASAKPGRLRQGTKAQMLAPTAAKVGDAAQLPGRPRQVTGPAVAAKQPAKPKSDDLPGRPAKATLGVAPVARASATATSPELPGRPRQATLGVEQKTPPPQAAGKPTGTGATDHGAKQRERSDATGPRRAGPRFIDHVSAWMRANPGPKTRDELVSAAIDDGWTDAAKAAHLVDTTVPRHRDLFFKNTDGTFVLRAERESRNPAKPGRRIKRRGGIELPVSRGGHDDGATGYVEVPVAATAATETSAASDAAV
jgi:hypothetical protein